MPNGLARDQPDAPPIDVEWFRVMRAKARACLQALDAGDQDEFHALIGHIAAAKECTALAVDGACARVATDRRLVHG